MAGLRKTLNLVLVLSILATTLLVFAKSKGRDKQTPDATFSSHTQMVLVPVIVTDKSGQHITGLKQEDFSVHENGAEQKIATFEEISSPR